MSWGFRTNVTIGLGLAVAFALTAGAGPARAHWADLSVAEIAVTGTTVRVLLTFPTALVGGLDDDHDGHLSPAEVRRHRATLEELLAARVRLRDRAGPGALTVQPAETPAAAVALNAAAGTHTTLLLTYTWPRPIGALVITYELFEPGVSTASCLATILEGGRVRSVVFTPERRELALGPDAGTLAAQAAGFVALGIQHIATGYDHILFLITLLALGGRMRSLLKIVSAFTIAHSITLSLAVLNMVALPARWVESAIAFSIVYVAVENFWKGEEALRTRWLITFAFGLVHGLGFASILKEMAIPRAGVALSLASFNLGVELGQIAVVAAAAAGLRLVRAWPRQTTVRRIISAGAGLAGLIWFIERAILSG